MQHRPLVSIVLPTYNGEKFIKEALDAIINQTYQNWELIVVNDCSTDSTPEIIKEYIKKDSRIRTINNDVNKKVPASLNIGFKEAKGEYYTWTSDDNYYYPNAIEKMVEFLNQHEDYGMVYTCTNVEENNTVKDEIWCTRETNPISILEICVPGACFLYRANVAKEVGEYNETEYYLNDDHEYWLRMLLKTKIGNIPDICYLYRLREGALTHIKQDELRKNKLCLLQKYIKIYSKIFDEVKTFYKDELMLYEFLDGKLNFSEIKKHVKQKKIYSFLKKEFVYRHNYKAIKAMKKLSFIYCLKAIKTELKNKNKFFDLQIRRYGDERGYLTTVDDAEIPFQIKRVYYISDVSENKERAHHAHKRSQRVLSVIQGSVNVSLFDGVNKKNIVLNSSDQAVYFDKHVWCELSNFRNNAIVLALASENYDESDYIRNYEDFIRLVNKRG